MTTTSFHGTDKSANAEYYVSSSTEIDFYEQSSASTSYFQITGGKIVFYMQSTAASALIGLQSGSVDFYNVSTAGQAAIYAGGGPLIFHDSSNAGTATIVGVNMSFQDYASAANSRITLYQSGSLSFGGHSTAGSSTITNTSPTSFVDFSTAGTATLHNLFQLSFYGNSTAGSATIDTAINAITYFFPSSGPAGDHKLTAGSLTGGGSYVLGGNQMTLGGTAALAGLFSASPYDATVSATLIAPGATTVGDTTINSNVLFRDTGTVVQTGTVTIGDSSNKAAQVTVTGVWQIAGDLNIAAGGTGAVLNIGGGFLAKTAGTATRSVIAPNIENLNPNTGTIRAKVGKLEFGGTLSGALSLVVNTGATLLVDKAASAGTAASFIGGGGTLQLNDAPEFAGSISGFGAGQQLDLRSILDGSGTSPSLNYADRGASGVLTVSDGAHTAALALNGSYSQSAFHLGTDNHGGSLVTYG